MVTSERLEPWLYRQGFNVDSWLLHDAFSHDSDLLAKALHNTVSAPPQTLSPSSVFFHSSTHTLSSNTSAGSTQELVHVGAKRKHNSMLTSSQEKAKKRRSRASKKPHTTFITTDPSNFRQMVQEVTGGAKYIVNDTSTMLFPPILKPEPCRFTNRLSSVTSEKSTVVPTLDTSAFLSNHHQENLVVGSSDEVGLSSAKSNAKSGSDAEFDDPYPTFPTLESWKVM
ncbi:hypothetical protein N665_2808s0007 [Sinapis alba]|nr:hypothetical protein N665_2808s0007 [Sinapis alba]